MKGNKMGQAGMLCVVNGVWLCWGGHNGGREGLRRSPSCLSDPMDLLNTSVTPWIVYELMGVTDSFEAQAVVFQR